MVRQHGATRSKTRQNTAQHTLSTTQHNTTQSVGHHYHGRVKTSRPSEARRGAGEAWRGGVCPSHLVCARYSMLSRRTFLRCTCLSDCSTFPVMILCPPVYPPSTPDRDTSQRRACRQGRQNGTGRRGVKRPRGRQNKRDQRETHLHTSGVRRMSKTATACQMFMTHQHDTEHMTFYN